MAVRSQSWLGLCIRKMKFIVRDAAINSEFEDDQEVLDLIIRPAWAQVYEQLAASQGNPVVARFDFYPTKDKKFYELPPLVRRVLFLGKLHRTTQGYEFDSFPRARLNPVGPGWALNGNVLELSPVPQTTITGDPWSILYIPNGDCELHEGSCTKVSDTVVEFGASPSFGRLGRRYNEYGGCILRLSDSSLSREHEIGIESYDPETRRATLRTPLPSDFTGSIEYEALPPLGMDHINLVALKAAMEMLAIRSARDKYGTIVTEFASARKAARSVLTYIEARIGPRMQGDVMQARDPLSMI